MSQSHVALIITTLGGGGAEKALVLLANELVERGFRVSAICLEWEPVAYLLDERVEIVRLADGRGATTAQRLLVVPLMAWRLSRWLNRLRPDVALSFLVRANFAHILTRWLGNRQRIIICEQLATGPLYLSQGLPGRLMLALTRWLYPLADKLLATSRGIVAGLEATGALPKSVAVIPNPVSVEECAPTGAQPTSVPTGFGDPACPTVITMGRLSEQKDHETLLRAFALVVQKVPANLLILGEGPLRGRTEQLVSGLGLSHRVRMPGFFSDPFQAVRQSQVFVLSSRYEGFGNVVVEALACGVPVVSTDCPSGPAEILADGAYGSLVPPGDPEALAGAILSALALSEEQRIAVGQRNRRRAADFDVRLVAPLYLEELGLPVPERISVASSDTALV